MKEKVKANKLKSLLVPVVKAASYLNSISAKVIAFAIVKLLGRKKGIKKNLGKV